MPRAYSPSPSPPRTPSPPLTARTLLHRLLHGPASSHRAPPSRAHLLALARSYAPDYALTALLWLLFALLTRSGGFRQQFSISDTSIQHSYAAHERVPFWLAGVVAAAVPFVLILLIGGFWLRSLYDVHSATLGLLLALALTNVLTDICKLTVGRPRPDLLARCLLPPNTTNAGPPAYGLVSPALCTQPDASLLADGFKSFFSGHSSFAFAGLGFLSLYLAGKLRLWDRRGYAAKPWICGAPLVGAALVAISRVMDYRHHWQDVVVGSAVGWLMSWFVYRLYYPPLTSPHASKPYAPRIPAPAHQPALLPLHAQGTSRHLDTSPSDTVPEGTVPRPRSGQGREEWDLGAGAGAGTGVGAGVGKYTDDPRDGDGNGNGAPGGVGRAADGPNGVFGLPTGAEDARR